MSARDALLATLGILKDCLNDQALIDKAPSEVAHNKRAAMLRQGLAVLTFSAVETFIRERTAEVLGSLTNTRLTFSDLSPALQKATTMGAMEGVRFRLKLQPSADKVSWLVSNLAPIAAATTNIRGLSGHSFGYSASNLSEDDVRDILKAFGVEAPWNEMTLLTRRIGWALLSCESEFEAIKTRRHASAHALTSQVPYVDLLNSLSSSLAICLAFDLLLSHCVAQHNRKRVPGVGGVPRVLQSGIKLVFVTPHVRPNSFALRREQAPPPSPVLRRPTVRVFDSELDAVTFGASYIVSRYSQLVALDSTSTPTKWFTW